MIGPPLVIGRRATACSAVLAILLITRSGEAPAALETAETDAARIAAYAEQLSHPDFHVRDEASRQLVRYGRAAIPAVTRQALDNDLESSLRGLHILNELFDSTDKATWQATFAALKAITQSPNARAAARAQNTLDGHRRIALTRIRNSGASLQDQNRTVQLSDNWSGGDEGLLDLRWLPDLRVLRIIKAPITDAALANLKWLDKLGELGLIDVPVTDRGVSHLGVMKNLTILYLTNTRVSEISLRHVAQHRQITWLNLVGTKVTERGLPHLARLTNLKTLELDTRDIDPINLEALKRVHPQLNISLTEDDHGE